MSADYEDMNCWSDKKVAFMVQMWFFGFIAKIFAAPLLETFGHQVFLNWVLIPINIIGF
jgi:hypothetical protein